MPANILLSLSLLSVLSACQPAATPQAAATARPTAAELVARGEYLVKVGGCNDCHTAGYGPAAGKVPTRQWLTGSDQGFLGPWGTTYPSNLRLSMSKMSEDQWVAYSSSFRTRPPMPDFMVRGMPEADRRALHRFVTSLGASGGEAPAFLPPGQVPAPPYFQLVLPPAPAASAAPGAASKDASGT